MLRVIVPLLLLMMFCQGQISASISSRAIEGKKKNLVSAQKKLVEQQSYIIQLEEEIARSEIASIQKEISKIHKKTFSNQDWHAFFQPHREILGRIIHSHPTCRNEAQEVLDQILVLITQLNN